MVVTGILVRTRSSLFSLRGEPTGERTGGLADARQASKAQHRKTGELCERSLSRNGNEEEETMRVFVVGASGAIGSRLVPQLIERGHEVIGSARSSEKAQRLRGLRAESVVLDALDARAVREAVAAARPDAIVHQATALTGFSDLKHFDRGFARTNRLRTEGTDNLLAAAREAGVGKFVAQSFASYGRYAREGGPVKSEGDPLDPKPVAAMRETMAAADHLDKAVAGAGGIALRYGTFYGDPDDGLVEAVRVLASSRSSATGPVSGRSSTLTTPPRRPCSRSSTTAPPSTTSSTTSPPPPASGCLSSRGSSGPSRRNVSHACSLGSSRAKPP
jgi:uncharacterized protein YbjT (DUF2867 family)